jgi:Gluconate 2-dehydrogenase subunit 3
LLKLRRRSLFFLIFIIFFGDIQENLFLMNRRNVIKNLVIASGSLMTLPAWMGCGTPATHLSSFSLTEQQLLAGIADTIIPAGNPAAIGALSVGVDKFLQKLFDDCYEKDVQDNVKSQLRALATSAETGYEKPFGECSQVQREELLLELSVSAKKAETDFFKLIKTETVRGFNTSQEVMQKYLNYKIAPGYYYGCTQL